MCLSTSRLCSRSVAEAVHQYLNELRRHILLITLLLSLLFDDDALHMYVIYDTAVAMRSTQPDSRSFFMRAAALCCRSELFQACLYALYLQSLHGLLPRWYVLVHQTHVKEKREVRQTHRFLHFFCHFATLAARRVVVVPSTIWSIYLCGAYGNTYVEYVLGSRVFFVARASHEDTINWALRLKRRSRISETDPQTPY